MYINVNEDTFKLINDGLNYGEILLYSLITSYCESGRECFPSNEYLKELFHTSERNIQIWLKKLREEELIKYEYENGKRYLAPDEKYFTTKTKNLSP